MYSRSPLLKFCICAAICMASASVQANSKDSFGFWNQELAQGNFGFLDPDLKDLRWWAEGQIRVYDQLEHVNQGLARGALGYALNEDWTVWAGYTWNPTRYENKPQVDEHDLFSALTYTHMTPFGTFVARSMLDFRFVANASKIGSGDTTGFRYRQLARFIHPLAFAPSLSLVGWDEIFFNVNDTNWGQHSGIDQNRAFTGLGWNFNQHVRIEAGYMDWFLNTRIGQDTVRHMMAVNFQANF